MVSSRFKILSLLATATTVLSQNTDNSPSRNSSIDTFVAFTPMIAGIGCSLLTLYCIYRRNRRQGVPAPALNEIKIENPEASRSSVANT